MDDNDFRWILLVGLLLLAPVGLYYRFRSHTGEKLDRTQEGLFILVALRLLGVVGLLGMLAFLINPIWMKWSSVPLPVSARWAGVVLGILGGLLMTWTFRTLGSNLTDTVVTRRVHTLITAGPYDWVRHPFYGAGGMLVAAVFLISGNVFFLVTGAAAILLLVIRTRREEQRLLERFGDAYRRYMATTGRFFPRIRSGPRIGSGQSR